MANLDGGLQPNPQYIVDKAFFAQQGTTESLPVSNPTAAATSQEPVKATTDNSGAAPQENVEQPKAPVVPVNPLAPQFALDAANQNQTPKVADVPVEAAPAADDTDDLTNLFSTDIPDVSTVPDAPAASSDVTQGSEPVVTTTAFDEFKPAAEAPDWQRQQFADVVNNQTLTDEEKREVLSGKPYGWGKEVKRVRDSRILGKFRDPNVPVGDVLNILRDQNKTRVEQLEAASVAALIDDGEKVLRFAEEQPETYAKLMYALVDGAHEQVASILGKHGYVIQKAEPVNADSILDKLKANPYYGTIAGTDFEEEITAEIERLAQSQPAAPAEQQNAGEPQTAAPQNEEYVQRVNEAYATTQAKVWDKALSDGLTAKGIRPATEAEINANPLAMLKTVIHAIGVHGLDGVVPKSDEQIDKFVGENSDYTETVDTLGRLLASGETDKFKELARELAPTYYRFGEARANMPFVKGLYKQVQKLLGEVAAPAPDPAIPNADDQKIPETSGGVPTATSAMIERLSKSPNAADRLLAQKLQQQG